MNKRLFLSLATLPLLGTAGQAEAAKPQDRPNIILFLVDDMGWQDTSLPFWKEKTHYNEVYETPNMERLARQGMMFTQAYASSISSPLYRYECRPPPDNELDVSQKQIDRPAKRCAGIAGLECKRYL